MIGRAAIGYPWILTKSNITQTGEHLAKPTVIDRVEAATQSPYLGNGLEGERLGIVETRPITLIISKEFIF
jgi:tRNA-dihydrouridine synthase